EGVLAKIETCDSGEVFRFPMTDAKVAFFFFVEFGARGCKAQTARPAHGQVVTGEVGRVTNMRIPAFAGADEIDAIAGILNDTAGIVDGKTNHFPSLWG